MAISRGWWDERVLRAAVAGLLHDGRSRHAGQARLLSPGAPGTPGGDAQGREGTDVRTRRLPGGLAVQAARIGDGERGPALVGADRAGVGRGIAGPRLRRRERSA